MKTFGELATYYAATSLQPAEYRDGRKIHGRRSLSGVHASLGVLCEFFGARPAEGRKNAWTGGLPLRGITYGHLDALRLERLATPALVTKKNPAGRPRTIASVNRELQMLRNMLNVARRNDWLDENPFSRGASLISAADERQRRRVLSFEEEARLLAQCVDRREERPPLPPIQVHRSHLRAIVVCALDTAMRRGELRWRDLDTMGDGGGRRITVQQMNTKTLEERGAPISRRLQEELGRLRAETLCRPDDLVFGITSDFKQAWRNACRDAGITGLRFHDLRRTAATRLHREGMSIGEVSRLLGHKQITTTFRYIGVDQDMTDRAAEFFDRINERAQRAAVVAESEAVN